MTMNRIKRILSLLAVLALFTGVFAGSALAAGYVQATGSRVNVRSGPGEGYADLWTMVKGEQLSYLNQSSVDSSGVTWYKVQYYSYGEGWVSSRYATLNGASSNTGNSWYGSGYVRAKNGNVNIRSTPSLNGRDLDTIPKGDTAEYLGQTSVDDRGVTWYKVRYDGNVGWASSRYSELVGSSSNVFLPDLSTDETVQATGDCNIRNIPSLSGTSYGVMRKGASAEYLGQSSVDDRGVTWYKVDYRGTIGWVSSRYSELYGAASTSGSFATGWVQSDDGDSNIRNTPSLSGGVLGVMKKGASASYLNQSSVDNRGVTWYKVNYNGTTGWVSSRYTNLY